MYNLRTMYPDTWNERVGGSPSVSKNGVPFTSVGADHACEHLNRQMKVKSGLVGISNNINARQRFLFGLSQKYHACQQHIGDSFKWILLASWENITTSARVKCRESTPWYIRSRRNPWPWQSVCRWRRQTPHDNSRLCSLWVRGTDT